MKLFLFVLLLPLVFCADINNWICSETTYNSQKLWQNYQRITSDMKNFTPYNGHATFAVGEGRSTVFGLFQCRGDIGIQDCSNCIVNASRKLGEECPNTVVSRIWFDVCFIRHEVNYFFASLYTSDAHFIHTGSAFERFASTGKNKVWELLTLVMSSAYSERNRFGVGRTAFYLPRDQNHGATIVDVFGMAQCTNNLQSLKCLQCLETMIGMMKSNCMPYDGCFVQSSSCAMRYEGYNFLHSQNIPTYQ